MNILYLIGLKKSKVDVSIELKFLQTYTRFGYLCVIE